jgi:HlyD family secretion protein
MTEIKSPIDGKILDIIVRKGDSTTDRPIMIVADTDNMQCLAEVNDSLLQHIVLDENANPRVKITSPAFESAIWGNVVNKGLMISPPSLKNPNPFASVDRRTGTLTIALDDNETAAQFVNLQVEVEVEVIPGSLTQPQQSPAD